MPPGSAGAPAMSLGIIEHRLDLPAKARCGFGHPLPNRLQGAKDGVRVDFINGRGPYRRAVCLQRVPPLASVLLVTPFALLGLDQRIRAFPECRLGRLRYGGQMLFTFRHGGIDAERDILPSVHR